MGKTMLMVAFICLSVVAMGTAVMPQNPLFWLLSSHSAHQYARLLLLVIMLAQLRTNPPRNPYFRVITGALGAFVGAWALQETYEYLILPTDTLMYLGSALAIIITSLELPAEEIPKATKTKPA